MWDNWYDLPKITEVFLDNQNKTNQLTNSMPYETWKFSAAFTRALNNPYPRPN
jgi:hypothetical protein